MSVRAVNPVNVGFTVQRTTRLSGPAEVRREAGVDVAVRREQRVDGEAEHPALARRDATSAGPATRLTVPFGIRTLRRPAPLGDEHRAVGEEPDVPRVVETGEVGGLHRQAGGFDRGARRRVTQGEARSDDRGDGRRWSS